MSKKISIKQFLMKSGRFEKVYDCINSIRKGRVLVNNKIIKNPNYFFNPKNALVKLNNEKIKSVNKLYFIYVNCFFKKCIIFFNEFIFWIHYLDG